MNDEAFEEWLKESIGAMAAVRQVLKSAGFDPATDIAELNTLYDKGVRPFYFFTQERAGGTTGPTPKGAGPAESARVIVTDGPAKRTYDRRAELAKDGLIWDKKAAEKGAWVATVPRAGVDSFKAKYADLNVEVATL